MFFRLNAVSPKLLAWLPVCVVLLLVVWLLCDVRLALTPELQHRAERDLQRRAEFMAEGISAHLDSQWRDLRHLARLPLLNGDGQALPAARAELDALLQDRPAFVWLGLVSPEGRVLAASGGVQEGQSLAQRAAFIRTWRNGHFLGDFQSSALLQAPVVGQPELDPQLFDLAVRLHDSKGRPAGVLMAHLGAGWLHALQRQAQIDLPGGHSVRSQLLTEEPPPRPRCAWPASCSKT